MPTDAEIWQALVRSADREGVRWRFRSVLSGVHSETEAKDIVRIYLTLGIEPITDILSSAMFARMLDRLVALESAVCELRERAGADRG